MLESIYANNCIFVEEVFEVALLEVYDSQSVVTFPKLREVELCKLGDLQHIWKNNQWRKLEFPNLKRLSIYKCESMEYVFTCSMVGCVMQLQELHTRKCGNMKAVVKDKKEGDCDAKVSEIIEFPSLRSLRLQKLSSLKGFSLGNVDFALSYLDTLEIKKCPRISLFTKGRSVAPKLTVVETSFGSFNVYVGEDINSFIVTRKQEGYKFGGLDFSYSEEDEDLSSSDDDE